MRDIHYGDMRSIAKRSITEVLNCTPPHTSSPPQLPPDLDVEQIVSRTLAASKVTSNNRAASMSIGEGWEVGRIGLRVLLFTILTVETWIGHWIGRHLVHTASHFLADSLASRGASKFSLTSLKAAAERYQ